MNLRVGVLAGLLIALLLGGHMPVATAQSAACGTATSPTCDTTLEIVITPPTTPVRPLGPFLALPVTVKYKYTPVATVAFVATPVDLTVQATPPWVVATLSPATVYMTVDTVSGGQAAIREATSTAFLLVSTTADAPAFTQGPIAVTGLARANGALKESNARFDVPIQADFFSIIEATVPSTIQKAKPQAQVAYPITVTNFGNALTKVTFNVEAVPEKWQVTPPSPITLESRQQGRQQTSKLATLTIQTPFQNGYLNVVGAITVRLTTNYALDPKVVGDSTIVSTLTTTKGFYVPGFDAAFLPMAAAAVALALAGRPWDRRG